MLNCFDKIHNFVKNQSFKYNYFIPYLWDKVSKSDFSNLDRSKIQKNINVNPYKYLDNAFTRIKNLKKINDFDNYKWEEKAKIYSIFIRNFSAYDHNNDKIIGGNSQDITLNNYNIRETGTFLKTIALLPYIYNLGFNTIYLLPVFKMGNTHKKGELSSPYSIKNIYNLDESYSDPLINKYFTVKDEFKAFVEACHHLGFKVILDFALRTSSRDSDLIKEHPDWFYWIYEDRLDEYRMPVFTGEDFLKVKKITELYPEINDTVNPSEDFISLFAPISEKNNIEFDGTNYYSYHNNRKIIVPGVFSDWPFDKQPLWTDITYYRYYLDKNYNFIAYNTVRYYDKRIKEENTSLWDYLSNVIPYFIEKFDIDGARIDMAHAMPEKLEKMIIKKAKGIKKDFIFISENFDLNAKDFQKGYNAITGDFCFFIQNFKNLNKNNINSVYNYLDRINNSINYCLAQGESADTKRLAYLDNTLALSKLSWILANLFPKTIPFCNAGFELGEIIPLNFGIGFNSKDIEFFKDKDIAFFNRGFLSNWNNKNSIELLDFIKNINNYESIHRNNVKLIINKKIKLIIIELNQYYIFINIGRKTLIKDLNKHFNIGNIDILTNNKLNINKLIFKKNQFYILKKL